MPLLKGQIFSTNLIYTMLINRGDQMICDHCQKRHLLQEKNRKEVNTAINQKNFLPQSLVSLNHREIALIPNQYLYSVSMNFEGI